MMNEKLSLVTNSADFAVCTKRKRDECKAASKKG